MAPFLSATGCVVDGVVGDEGDDPPHPLIVIDTPPSMASKAATVNSRRSARSSRSFCSFMAPNRGGILARTIPKRLSIACCPYHTDSTCVVPRYLHHNGRFTWILRCLDFGFRAGANGKAIRTAAASADAIFTRRPARHVRVGTRSRTTR